MIRLAWATFGRVLFGRAAAMACGIGLVAAIVFAPHGVRAADVIRWTDAASPIARLCPWMLWLALAVPPVGAALRAPGTKLLRTLPISARQLAGTFFAFVLVLHLPWAMFFHRATGPLRAASSTALALACVAACVAPRRVFPIAMIALALGFAPPIVGLAVGVPLAAIAFHLAWRHGAEPRSLWTVPIPKIGIVAIAIAYALVFVRRERVRAAFAIAVCAIGWMLGDVFARNGGIDRRSLMVVPSVCIAQGAIAPVLAREAKRLEWISPRPWVPHVLAAIPSGALHVLALRWKRGGTEWALVVIAYAIVATCIWRIAC